MSQVSAQTAAEFVRLYDTLISAGIRAVRDAEQYADKYRRQGDHFNANRWERIIDDLRNTLNTNYAKRDHYADEAGAHYDVPAYLKRQAE